MPEVANDTTPVYVLSECVDQLLLRKGNDRRKYYSRWISIAQDVYRDLYKKVLPTVISRYVQVNPKDEDNELPYVWKPANMQRFFGIWITDKKGNLKEVYYNDKLNVFTKPVKQKKCGCQTTDLCDCIDNLEVVITPVTIDGTTYYNKQWVKCCDNGDVLQYSEIWVKDYSTIGGDYSDDYGDDYNIVQEGNNIVLLRFTKNLGRLETKPCGCPVESEENTELIFSFCGRFLPLKPKCCNDWYKDRIPCSAAKFSECGTKIYLKNVVTDGGFVVISYQTDGIACGEETVVPEYARKALWAGMEVESITYSPRSSESQIKGTEIRYTKAKSDLFEYLNPINKARLFSFVSSEIKL